MRPTGRSALPDVAVAVGDALRRAGIRAVLTGGACASLYTAGAYLSHDADFVLADAVDAAVVARALAGLGYRRVRDRYVHARTRFVVEFPPGPLGIGEDFRIRPVRVVRRGRRCLALSATDSCRDRLAVFYHWTDRQCLAVAVRIALRHRVALSRIRAWSRAEGHDAGFAEFLRALERARARRRRATR